MPLTPKYLQSPLRHLSLLLMLVVVLLPHCSPTLDVEQLCEIRCNIGRGGVLCKCNAFHFAGKRSDDSSRYWVDLAAAFNDRKYTNPHGGVTLSASGVDKSYDAEEKKRSDGWMDERKGEADFLAEGLLTGGQGNSAVSEGLASMLKTAWKKRLINVRREGHAEIPKWRKESSFPFTTDEDGGQY